MVVVAVGVKHQYGQIQEKLQEKVTEETPLQEKLQEIAKLVGYVVS